MKKLIAIWLGVTSALLGTAALATRNSSGTHSFADAPFTTGTVISSSVMNTKLGDLSNEMTDSLSRSGKGGMTAPLRGSDGTIGSPAYSFTSETGTGLFRAASGNVQMVMGSSPLQIWTSTVATRTATTSITDTAGSNTATLDQTGYAVSVAAGNVIRFAVAGTNVITATGNTLSLVNVVPATGNALAGVPVTVDSGWYRPQTWTTLTFSPNCSNGTPTPAYTVRLGTVHLRGQVTMPGSGGTCAASALAAGSRPGATFTFIATLGGTGSVSTAGVVTLPVGAAGTNLLDGISFPAEQ